ncbi:COQ2 [Sanghuangporus vaninii]
MAAYALQTPISVPLAYIGIFGTGALVMRGAGCTINDMWDMHLDKAVERTKERPLARGDITPTQAFTFLGVQLTAGLAVLLQLNWYSILLGACSLSVVSIYPFMKRVTYWPQAVLGLAFNWGALLGWSAVAGSVDWRIALPLYAGGICWTLVYDSIYAHQDKTDDRAVGIRSTALLFGDRSRSVLSALSASSVALIAYSGFLNAQGPLFYTGVGLATAQLTRILIYTDFDSRPSCWRGFVGCGWAGFWIWMGALADFFSLGTGFCNFCRPAGGPEQIWVYLSLGKAILLIYVLLMAAPLPNPFHSVMAGQLLVRLALLFVFFRITSSIHVSRTVDLYGEFYYLAQEPIAAFPASIGNKDILPVTVIITEESVLTDKTLKKTIEDWKKYDDVLSAPFLKTIVLLNGGKKTAGIDTSVISYLKELGVEDLFVSGSKSFKAPKNLRVWKISGFDIPAGPYMIARDAGGTTSFYQARKLYFDETQSFYKSTYPLKDGSFSVVSASLDTDSSPYIAVPSRIYADGKDKKELPLAGVRVSVKDIYYIKGLKTSFQFANGDRATADWVDYHAPFVLRGDGYREPSGSSTGAGASISAHEWVDVAIGSDTGGSIRGPAGANGIYGIRPSVGAITLADVMPLSDVLDTAGYLTRDPYLFRDFGKAWYAENELFRSYPSFPKQFLLSPSFATVNADASAIYADFFAKLTGLLGATMQNFSIAETWNATNPVGVPVNVYLNETYPTLTAYHQWTVVGSKLFADYAAANGGRNPHINPAVLSRWQYGQEKGEAGYVEELAHRQVFEEWAANNFLLADPETCSKSIYLYPQSAGTYSSRETYFLGPSAPPIGFSDGRVAVHGRTPDIVVPLGQVPYNSTISGITEFLPVSISLVARRGCDFMLLDLVGKLADAGVITKVKTGRTAF